MKSITCANLHTLCMVWTPQNVKMVWQGPHLPTENSKLRIFQKKIFDCALVPCFVSASVRSYSVPRRSWRLFPPTWSLRRQTQAGFAHQRWFRQNWMHGHAPLNEKLKLKFISKDVECLARGFRDEATGLPWTSSKLQIALNK